MSSCDKAVLNADRVPVDSQSSARPPQMNAVKRMLSQTSLGRVALMPYRFAQAVGCHASTFKRMLSWVFTSREYTNFTYELTPRNQEYLAHTISIVTEAPYALAMRYIGEIQEDVEVRQHIVNTIRSSPL